MLPVDENQNIIMNAILKMSSNRTLDDKQKNGHAN